MSKLILNIDSTCLGHSACILDWYRTVIGSLDDKGQSQGGYREIANAPELTYGTAIHRFIEVAYKTRGDLARARKYARELFDNIPTREHKKKAYLRDGRHFDTTCINVWNDYIEVEESFDLFQLNLACWMCKGTGINGSSICPICEGKKQFEQPACEVTFSIKYYEDDYIIVNLTGTIDKIGRFRNGCYAIGDWKTSGTWDNRGYFQQYELSRQLRFYSLAIKLMGVMYPDSILGKMGASYVGCFIDAIFLNTDPNKVSVERSEVYTIKPPEIEAFQMTLDDKIKQLSNAIKTGYIPKEGIINGSCIKWQNVTEQNFAKCAYWDCCRNPDNVAEMLLKRNFKQVPHDPLKYNEV